MLNFVFAIFLVAAHAAELPSGEVALAGYRAPYSVLKRFSDAIALAGGDLKDNPRAPECTRAELAALKRYTSQDFYREINGTLRKIKGGKVDGKEISAALEDAILVTASGVACAPQYEGDVTRREDTPAAVLATYVPGRDVTALAFTSTTKGAQFAQSVSHQRHEIHIAHARGADIDAIGISQWPTEHEILVAPGAKFRVLTRVDYPDAKGTDPLTMLGFRMY